VGTGHVAEKMCKKLISIHGASTLTVCGMARKLFQHTVARPEIFVLVPPITPRCLGITFFCTLYYNQVLIVIW